VSRHAAAGLDPANCRPQVLIAAISGHAIRQLKPAPAVHAATWMSLKPAVDRRGSEQLARGAGRELAEGEPPSA